MRGKLKKVQEEYALKIKNYLESLKVFEGWSIRVNFNVDYEFHEYFIIWFNKDAQLILECEKIPYLRWHTNVFKHWNNLHNTDDVIHRLASDQCIYINLIKLAEEYYKESKKILES